MEKAEGSSPSSSTYTVVEATNLARAYLASWTAAADCVGSVLAGFIAGEGSFVVLGCFPTDAMARSDEGSDSRSASRRGIDRCSPLCRPCWLAAVRFRSTRRRKRIGSRDPFTRSARDTRSEGWSFRSSIDIYGHQTNVTSTRSGATRSRSTNASTQRNGARGRPSARNPAAIDPCAVAASAGVITTVRPATEFADHIAGFVAAEGTFIVSGNPPSFTFAVALGSEDRESCASLSAYFGIGHVRAYSRRKAHFDDEIVFGIRKLKDLVEVVVPFMDEHLPPSHKREQYLAWRTQLLDYWEHRARRRRACTVEGCDKPQRAKGVCRRHHYERFGS
jgi:hypothetical protein